MKHVRAWAVAALTTACLVGTAAPAAASTNWPDGDKGMGIIVTLVPNPCWLVQTSDVAKALGSPVAQQSASNGASELFWQPDDTHVLRGRQCDYTTRDGQTVRVRAAVDFADGYFWRAITGTSSPDETITHVNGLGDDAVIYNDTVVGIPVLFVKKGYRYIAIYVNGTDPDGMAKAQVLARNALDRL
jgi:hypothetical protein